MSLPSSEDLSKFKPKPFLPPYEWLAIISIILFIGTLSLGVLVFPNSGNSNSNPPLPPHYISDQTIEVVIEGAVTHPGVYKLTRGAKLQELLEKAKPLELADIKKLKVNKVLRTGQVIKVPQIKTITISIKGAVKSAGTITLAKGTRVSDLIEKLEFIDGADISKLKKKRLLKDGEEIHVPQRMKGQGT